MSEHRLLAEQKNAIKIEEESFVGFNRNIISGTPRVYTDYILFSTNDTFMDVFHNNPLSLYTKIKNIPEGSLTIPMEAVADSKVNAFRVAFMQYTLYIILKDGHVLIFRMMKNQAEKLANCIVDQLKR